MADTPPLRCLGSAHRLDFASAPFLFDVLSRGMEWIAGLFPHPDNLWKECSWCF